MKTLHLLLCLLPWSAFAQITDNFSDGDFTKNPSWKGDTAKFTVQTEQLKLSAPAIAGTAYLSVDSKAVKKATWSFLVTMGFNPSSSNYCKIYLLSDTSNLSSPLYGYYVRVGGTNDNLSLYRQEGTNETLLINGRKNMFNTSTVKARIQITRDEAGTWDLNCDTLGGTDYTHVGESPDSSWIASTHFGIQCIYTSTRSDKFSFDDFQVTGEPYTDPESVTDSTKLFGVVFNEIMADPTPTANLPDCEYIELYNRSSQNISLKNWQLYIGDNLFTLPDTCFIAKSHLLICSKNDLPKLLPFDKTIGIFNSSTTLNNSGQYLKLLNPQKRLIAWVEYSDNWYNDSYKSQGGYSLEQIDPENPCGGKTNWTASKNKTGGTPCAKNSVYSENPDLILPEIFRINIPADSVIDLYFTEPIDSIKATDCQTYFLTPGQQYPKKVTIPDRNFQCVRIHPPPLSPGIKYSLSMANTITDCAGNKTEKELILPFTLPEPADSSDVIINEVLFNANAYGTDYIEIYNRSAKTINSRTLFVAIKKDNKIENICRMSSTGYLIYPQSFGVITNSLPKVKNFYQCGDNRLFAEPECMPALDDKAGTIVLMDDQFHILDQFTYSDKMHLGSLINSEGVALERINPAKPSYFPGNWHSAAESNGYGTPGYKNSQYLNDSVNSNEISLDEQLFSPDNDGYKDILKISYKFQKPCLRAQVSIFDCTGRLVKRLLNNEVLGTSGFFTWDGSNDSGRPCNTGMYVLFIRTISEDGTIKDFKKSCILAIKR